MEKTIFGEKVFGIELDAETRCAHYHNPLDIIAIKFKCCEKWFPCFECHAEISAHPARVRSPEEFGQPSVLCGGCGHQLTANEYFNCDSACPHCRRRFNPNCVKHRHLYFADSD